MHVFLQRRNLLLLTGANLCLPVYSQIFIFLQCNESLIIRPDGPEFLI